MGKYILFDARFVLMKFKCVLIRLYNEEDQWFETSFMTRHTSLISKYIKQVTHVIAYLKNKTKTVTTYCSNVM